MYMAVVIAAVNIATAIGLDPLKIRGIMKKMIRIKANTNENIAYNPFFRPTNMSIRANRASIQ
jgi:hypothetical protein